MTLHGAGPDSGGGGPAFGGVPGLEKKAKITLAFWRGFYILSDRDKNVPKNWK